MKELTGLTGCVTWCILLVTWVRGQHSDITTTLGTVRGVRTTLLGKTLDIFYGIPFAKPPVGDLRFRRPLPPDPWNTTRDAVTMPNSCHSLIDTLFNKFEGVDMWNPNTPLSEDCLYLNVWAPRDGAANKAILVWIFGGTFTLGTSTLKVYDGTYLAIANDVIVVSMNYRVGALGFLNWGDDAPGNVGLLDQAMAIQWVKDNAVNFGGDPNRITLFGESAGAASVSMHMMSPVSRGLFNNAIMESSSSLCYWALHSHDTAKARTKKLAEKLNCTADDGARMMSCLRERDAQTLSVKAWDVVGYYFDVPFAPVVDKHFLLDTPTNLLARGEVLNTSILLGVNKDEGNYFLLYGISEYFKLNNPTPLTRQEYLNAIKKVSAPSNNQTQTAIAVEYEQQEIPADRDTYRNIIDDISGDRAFKCPTIDFARIMSTINPNVYLYSFEHRVSTNPWPVWTGVLHGYEIELVFGLPLGNQSQYTQEEVEFSRRLTGMWSDFAKKGNPNQDGSSAWPRFDTVSQKYARLNASYIIKSDQGLRHRQCTFWREIVPLFADRESPDTGKHTCINVSETVLPNYTMIFLTGALIVGQQLKQLCA